MTLDAVNPKFVLTDDVRHGPLVQINRRTFLVDDYVNKFGVYSFSFQRYREAKQYRPESAHAVGAELIDSLVEFPTYREQYLKGKIIFLNKILFDGKMTQSDQDEMADEIFSVSPRAVAVDDLSIAFKAELATIKTVDDIPRFEAIYAQYFPRFQALFRG